MSTLIVILSEGRPYWNIFQLAQFSLPIRSVLTSNPANILFCHLWCWICLHIFPVLYWYYIVLKMFCFFYCIWLKKKRFSARFLVIIHLNCFTHVYLKKCVFFILRPNKWIWVWPNNKTTLGKHLCLLGIWWHCFILSVIVPWLQL